MSDYIDKAKDLAKDLTDKARGAVTEHSDKIDEGIDKAAEFVDDKTKRKYSDRIESVQAKAHDVVGRITTDKTDGGTSPADTTSPETPPASSNPPSDA
jgi:MT0933-like antitoxin protein